MNDTELNRLDYRKNIIIDKNNTILVQKAWRDHFSDESHWKAGYGGEAYLGRRNSEDALTWNTFRSLQIKNGLGYVSSYLGISEIENVLFWGMDAEAESEYQILLNSIIRYHDGHYRGTVTEPDLVLVTKNEVVFIECKLNNNGNTSPWKAQSNGSEKRFYYYSSITKEIESIKNWRDYYQLIRNMFYAKEMSKQLHKQPIVFPLVNEKHFALLNRFYSEITPYSKVFSDMKTWQGLVKVIENESSNLFIELTEKIKLSL